MALIRLNYHQRTDYAALNYLEENYLVIHALEKATDERERTAIALK